MTPIKRLYLLAGFDNADVERQASELQRRHESGSVRFLARPYPSRPDRRSIYLKGLVQSANDLIFGKGVGTNFCRKQDQTCALSTSSGVKSKTCHRWRSAETACAQARPKLVVVICSDQLFDEAFAKLGRGTLFLRIPGPALPSVEEVSTQVDAFEPLAAGVVTSISNLDRSLLAPLLPYKNFQMLGDHQVARAIQADPATTGATLLQFHKQLYSADFRNPVKPKMRGAYMLDAHTAFQRDHQHKTVQIVGYQSRVDGFHLINAFHVYGVKTDPGFHFDVMNIAGKAIGHILVDALTGKDGGGSTEHLNATPCDRLL